MHTRDGWMGVELRHLAALDAVAREGSFCGAADRLGYVQSAVSQQIAGLERAVGIRLVARERGALGVALTEAGALLLDHVDEIMARLRAAQADLQALTDGRAGAVRVGAPERVSVVLLGPLVGMMARDWPDMRVVPSMAPCDAPLLEALERGELDLVFADLPLPPGPFHHATLLDDPYVLLVQAESSLADGVVAADLDGLPLVGQASERPELGVEALLRAQGIEPRIVYRADGMALVQSLVAAGVGAAIVPRLSVDERCPRTVAVDLSGLLPPRGVALCWQRERQMAPIVESFRYTARRLCAAGL